MRLRRPEARDREVGEEPERAAAEPAPLARAVLDAQRMYGNRAVSQLLREPNDALAVKTEAIVKHKTGKEIDTFLDSSPFFRDLVEDKVKGGTKAEGHVHIHTPAEFVKVTVDYLMTRVNNDTGENHTEEEAKAEERNISAFRDGTEIHVHKGRGEPATTVHESMHLFSHADFNARIGFNANEGATEYFTRKLCREIKLRRGNYYADQYEAVQKLAGVVGEDILAAAYFNGDIAGLRQATDTRAAFGEKVRKFFGGREQGVFGRWTAAMKAGRYDEANDLL
jgi:hypothetical protein